MFAKYGTLASTLLKRGLADHTSLVLFRHNNVYQFRSSFNQIQRKYCASNTSSADVQAKFSDQSLSNEILEVLDSPVKIGRDHKHYRYR